MTATSVPGLAVRALRPILAGLRALGHAPEPILAAAGIEPAALEDPEARVPHASVMALWTRAVTLTGDADLGLHVAVAAPIRSFDVHAYVLLSSPTLREAFERACRYQRLIHDTTELTLIAGERSGTLRHALPGGRAVPRQSAEFLAATWVRVGRLVTGSDWSPVEVRFAHPRPADVSEHERLFRAPLRFASGENALEIPLDALDAPNARADPGLVAVLEQYAGALLARAPRSAALGDRALAVLVAALHAGALPSAAAVARRLHMSTRSLQRGLAAEGTTLGAILDGVRHREAVRLLADPGRGVAEVAFLVGFSELSAFYRAFRRWTGATPSRWRAERGARRAPGP